MNQSTDLLGECMRCGHEIKKDTAKISHGLYWSGCCDAMIEGEHNMVAESAEPKHTPTPWKIRIPMPENKTLLMRDNHLGGWDGENVAEVFANSHGNALENAAFIVRAVNSHENLLHMAKRWHLLEHGSNCGQCAEMQAIAKGEGK